MRHKAVLYGGLGFQKMQSKEQHSWLFSILF